MPEFLFAPVPHQEAIDFIAAKPVMARSVFDELLPELKSAAFTIAGVDSAAVQQNVRDLIATVPAGQPWDVVKKQIVAQISPYLVDPNGTPEEQAKQARAAEAKAELLLRINGHQAYATAAHRVMMRQTAIFPFWQYQTIGDAHVRPSHAALNGLILPWDSPFWETHNPPWEWGCRCIKIPRTADDVMKIRAAKTDRPTPTGWVLAGNLQIELEKSNRLVRGAAVHNVAPTGTFRFDPDQPWISVAELKARYSPAVWQDFEKWARKTEIENGRTVWEWINRTEQVAAAPAPEVVSVSSGARQSPISAIMDIKINDRGLRQELNEALAAIDRTHDDGAVPAHVVRLGRSSALGEFFRDQGLIVIKRTGPWRRLTFAHETGHAIDYYAFGDPRSFASETDAAFAGWRAAIAKSDAVATLKAAANIPNRAYFLRQLELFARSYAQYIAYRSEDAAMLADVERILGGEQPWRQWQPDDFTPIAQALDELFTVKGWLP